MIDLTAIWPRRPIRQPRAKRVNTARTMPRRSFASAPATAISRKLPHRSRTLAILSAGLLLALLLAALNAAILLTVTTPQAAAAPLETGQSYAGGQAAPKIASVPALAGRAHNAAAIIALREKAAGATRYQPVMFALLLMQALVMGATTFYLWNRAGRVFAPGGRSRANRGSETIRRRSDLSRSADGYARG